MAAEIRFYLDENVPIAVATQLKRRSIEAVTVRDLGLLGDSDINHLHRATKMGFVLCTHDSDYVELAAGGMEHSGIVFGQQHRHGICMRLDVSTTSVLSIRVYGFSFYPNVSNVGCNGYQPLSLA